MRVPPLLVLAAIAAALGLAVPFAARWVTDLWWFTSIGQRDVFLLASGTQVALALGAGGIGFAAVWLNVRTALRGPAKSGPRIVATLGENPIADALAQATPGQLAGGLGLVVALLLGSAATTWWQDVLLALHGGRFGYTDPIYQLDASAYVFVLPLVREVRAALLGLVVVCTLASVAAWLSRGAVKVRITEVEGKVQATGLAVAPDARRHLALLVASWLLIVAVGVALSRFELLSAQRLLLAGPGYADVTARLPLLTVQAMATALAAATAWRAIDAARPGWLVLTFALLGLPWAAVATWPPTVQQFSVAPNELARETPYLQNHIEATRFAFDLDRIAELGLSGENALDAGALDRERATIRNVRLWDHRPLLATFGQVQEIRPYYEFVDVDNDRYVIDGELRQIMLSPRELPAKSLQAEARTWVNQRMTFTHGYGLALGPVNEVGTQGLPVLWIQDLPPRIAKPELRIDRPELYFGESMELEVLVRTHAAEFDFPRGDENVTATYAGTDGVRITGLARWLFAVRLGSTELLFNQDLTDDSRILLYRRITERVRRVAPFLRLDDDPYLVVADGRLVWMLDGYTHTDRFPYARAIGDAHDTWLRNSVKATVDAYDGTVTLYRTEDKDPIADAWAAAFPGLLRPIAEMPATLRDHVRVPETLFAIQAEQYATYHMDDPRVFYNREDSWRIPSIGGARMEPYYTVMRLPGGDAPEFIAMIPFVPAGKPNLAAWLVARNDGAAYGELRVYKFPKERMVYGPEMIVARINQDDAISEKISLWNQQGSQVQLGTLLVIPVEESLLYVQPLYLQASVASGAIPELKRVIVAYEDEIAMAPTLEEALAQIFRELPPPVAAPVTPGAPPPTDPLGAARHHWQVAREAAAAGDWAAFGAAMEALGLSLEAAPPGTEPPPIE